MESMIKLIQQEFFGGLGSRVTVTCTCQKPGRRGKSYSSILELALREMKLLIGIPNTTTSLGQYHIQLFLLFIFSFSFSFNAWLLSTAHSFTTKTPHYYLEPPKNEGTILLKTLPETLPNISEARALALPNLSHLVKAKALVKVNEMAMITSIKDKNWNFSKAKNAKTHHDAGEAYSSIQKTFESIGLIYLSGLAVSKTHMLPPFSSVSFHQRNPTRSLPAMFFTFQKSAARRRITVMKKKMKLDVKSVPRM